MGDDGDAYAETAIFELKQNCAQRNFVGAASLRWRGAFSQSFEQVVCESGREREREGERSQFGEQDDEL